MGYYWCYPGFRAITKPLNDNCFERMSLAWGVGQLRQIVITVLPRCYPEKFGHGETTTH